MVTSDTESFTAGGKTYRRQYWLIGMESTCKPELAFHAKTAPLLIVLRGLHMEVEHKSALAVEILAVREWVREYGLDEPDYCVIVDQDWHAAKVYHGTGMFHSSGEIQTIMSKLPKPPPREASQ